MSGQRAILNLSFPESIVKEIETIARKENKSKSQVMRDAFRVYKFRREWARIRMLGEETARRMGIESVDDVERIAG